MGSRVEQSYSAWQVAILVLCGLSFSMHDSGEVHWITNDLPWFYVRLEWGPSKNMHAVQFLGESDKEVVLYAKTTNL